MDSLQSYLVIASILFSLGIYGVITRKNAIAILMGIELILNSANINFIAFNRFGGMESLDGQVFSIFVIVLAAAEAAVALAIVINLFKNVGTVDEKSLKAGDLGGNKDYNNIFGDPNLFKNFGGLDNKSPNNSSNLFSID